MDCAPTDIARGECHIGATSQLAQTAMLLEEEFHRVQHLRFSGAASACQEHPKLRAFFHIVRLMKCFGNEPERLDLLCIERELGNNIIVGKCSFRAIACLHCFKDDGIIIFGVEQVRLKVMLFIVCLGFHELCCCCFLLCFDIFCPSAKKTAVRVFHCTNVLTQSIIGAFHRAHYLPSCSCGLLQRLF